MPPERRVRYLIIGAGPTGLGAAYRLKELAQHDFLLIDSEKQVGGLARSFRDSAGFTWDIGGHVQFSHYRYFDELMRKALGSDGWLHHERQSWVWMRGRFVPYPFQNNLRYLPREELWECVQGLVELYKSPRKAPQDFQEWIHATLGSGIARVFMDPYNFKVWAHPLKDMSYEWIGERVAVADLNRALKNILFEQDDLSWGPNNTFQFPKQGGTGAIWEAVAGLVGRDRIQLETALTSVDLKAKRAQLSDGTTIAYEAMLNTMPLDLFVECTKGLGEPARATARKLKFSSSNIVGLGLEGPMPQALKKKCWMYFPENDCPFYRVTVFSNYSPGNVADPSRQWSLMAEVSESEHKPVNHEWLIEDVITGMRNASLLLPETKIVSRWAFRAGHGYPTPFLGRNEMLQALHSELEPSGVYSRGRFGGWKYEVSNQDHSLMQGVEWANRIALGIPETTYFFPGTANSGWGK